MADLDIPLLLDRTASEPLSRQLAEQLRTAMREGRAAAGERLPSGRALAATLQVSRTVVTEAYQQLYAEGWLEGRHGSGTFVADIHSSAAEPLNRLPTPEKALQRFVLGMIDLRPGMPAVETLDTPAWRRAWRLSAASAAATEPRVDPHGLPELRTALAEQLRRTRGMVCQPADIMVTRGATNGLDLLAATVLRPGDRVGVEEPGYGKARTVLHARAAHVIPCPVDEHGLIVEGLPEDLRLIYTTPSHQFPLGGVLPVPRRQALVAWARRTGALLVEDDYDGEFRYDVAPLPALYGLDPEVVVHLGTTAKTLTPDVGVGWLVARPDLAHRIAVQRLELNDRTPVVPQEAVRILLDRGDLDRHIRRMRAEYARRRKIVVETLEGLPLRGDTAGLHMVLELQPGTTEAVITAAAEQGVLLDSLARHYGGTTREVEGLVIGYGSASTTRLRDACRILRKIISRASARRTA